MAKEIIVTCDRCGATCKDDYRFKDGDVRIERRVQAESGAKHDTYGARYDLCRPCQQGLKRWIEEGI